MTDSTAPAGVTGRRRDRGERSGRAPRGAQVSGEPGVRTPIVGIGSGAPERVRRRGLGDNLFGAVLETGEGDSS